MRSIILSGTISALFATLAFGQADIAARVNGAVITLEQIEEAVDAIVPRATFHGTLSEDRRKEFREKALEALITAELQNQYAVAQGMKVDSGSVKDQMKRIRESFRTSRDYHLWMENKHLNEDQLKVRVEKNLLVRAAVEKFVEKPARVSDQSLKDYYEGNPERFKEPESVRVRIISTKDDKKMNDILGSLKAGEDFGSVASRLSDDGYRVKGGDIGFVRRGMIYPLLEDRVFSLKPGERSEVIVSDGTLYLVKVEEKRLPRIVPFDEAREGLRKDLEKKRMADLQDKWLTSLRAKANIEVNPGIFEGSSK